MANSTETFREALAAYNNRDFNRAEGLFRRVIEADKSNVPALNLLVVVLMGMKRFAEAEPFIARATSLNQSSDVSFYNYGLICKHLGKPDQALENFSKALGLNPGVAETWNNRGTVFNDLNQPDLAIADFDKAIALNSSYGEAYANKAKSLTLLKRYDEACSAYDKALSINPDLEEMEGWRLHAKMRLCDWERLDKEIDRAIASVRAAKANCVPFVLLSLADFPDDHLRCARAWIAAKHPATAKSAWRGKVYKHEKIRLGYVSADLRSHAMAYLMAELFELHNKRRFSMTAFSLRCDDNSEMRRRLASSFDRIIDCHALSDLDVAHAIAGSEIDILVDLNGFTQDSRTNIFAHRPAPIQVNYLGYPGTMGAPYIDYIVGDKTLFTLADAGSYSEKLVQLPDSYQPNDRKRQISAKAVTRQDAGLPVGGFVFCCFNNNHKILPQAFDRWMRILKQVDGSVLWLLAENQTAIANLKREAEARGIDPARLVFANLVPLSDHLARHRLADLFLDTLPYNAHTTASDALWSGLPVLTLVGNAFAGRVAASLLKAVDLPELITHSPEQYEALAIELALNNNRLQGIREKLAENRLTTPLFDTPRYTKHLEAAYESMYQRYQAGLPPEHMEIAPIRTAQ